MMNQLASDLLLHQLRIDPVSQAVSEEVEAEDQHGDG